MSFGNSFGDSTPFGQKVIKVLGAHRKLFIFENKHEKQTLFKMKLGQQTLLFQAKKLPDILVGTVGIDHLKRDIVHKV